jgi:predicted Zn-dependent protease
LGAGRKSDAAALAKELDASLQPRVRAFGDLIDGEIALSDGRPADAAASASRAMRTANSWLARFLLARAHLAGGRPMDAVALLEECRTRTGEGLAAFLDDVPTYRYVAALSEWTARAHQAAKTVAPARVIAASVPSASPPPSSGETPK